MKILLFLLCFLTLQIGVGQVKVEKEERVHADLVPEKAKNLVASVKSRKIKWLKEWDGKVFTFEAKFSYKGKLYSVEFDSLGQLQDVELKVNKRVLTAKQHGLLDAVQDSLFSSSRIKKIQYQYTASVITNQEDFTTLLNSDLSTFKYSYEIEVKGKVKKSWKYYELLISEQGCLIQSREIQIQHLDVIEF